MNLIILINFQNFVKFVYSLGITVSYREGMLQFRGSSCIPHNKS